MLLPDHTENGKDNQIMEDGIRPFHTKIEKMIQTSDGTIVLESHSGFPFSESNLYLLSGNGQVVWKAEKPDPRALFSRIKLNDDHTLATFTINGQFCDLDLKTGKIVSSSSFK